MIDSILNFFSNAISMKQKFITETIATFYMVSITALIGLSLGTVIGIIMLITKKDGLMENKLVNNILDKIMNFFRALPFVILLALNAPITRMLVGTTIGNNAAIVPMVIITIPFFARQVESCLSEVSEGIVEAAKSMGSSKLQIVFDVYLREGRAGMIKAASLTIISIIGLTAMAGVVGGGGLGKVAISEGFDRFRDDVTIVATFLILIMVFLVQFIANFIIKKIEVKRR